MKFKYKPQTASPQTTALHIGASKTTAPQSAAHQTFLTHTVSPHTAVAKIAATIRTASLLLLLLTVLLLLAGCRSKHIITEKTITKTDSTAIWNLNDSLYKKEKLITNIQSDLQRLRDENIRLLNETSTHQISYDISAPINPKTGKSPIASERFTVSKSILEQTKNEYETLLQTAILENESLTQQNHNLHLTVEKLINENKHLTEKGFTSPFFNCRLLPTVVLLAVIVLIFVRRITNRILQ